MGVTFSSAVRTVMRAPNTVTVLRSPSAVTVVRSSNVIMMPMVTMLRMIMMPVAAILMVLVFHFATGLDTGLDTIEYAGQEEQHEDHAPDYRWD